MHREGAVIPKIPIINENEVRALSPFCFDGVSRSTNLRVGR
jgi:hypothetical protein